MEMVINQKNVGRTSMRIMTLMDIRPTFFMLYLVNSESKWNN